MPATCGSTVNIENAGQRPAPVSGTVTLVGFAIDLASPTGTGIDRVHKAMPLEGRLPPEERAGIGSVIS